MLVSPTYNSGTIVSLKIAANGQFMEIIAKHLSETDTVMHVLSPVALTPVKDGIGMMNFMFTSDATLPIEINKSLVVARATASKDAAAEYNKTISPVVETTTPSLIL